MSERATPLWKENIEDVFPELGKKGVRGELHAKRLLEEMEMDVTWHPSDKELQNKGHDLVANGLGIDVKNNLKTGEYVIVDQWKLMKSEAALWMHVNDDDPEDFVLYKVEHMKDWLLAHAPRSRETYYVPRDAIASFGFVST